MHLSSRARIALTSALTLVLSSTASAHFVFVHVVATGPHPRVELHFAESAWDGTEGQRMVDILSRVRSWLPGRNGDELRFEARPWGLVAPLDADSVPSAVITSLDYGVMDRGEPYLLHYHAKGVTRVEDAATTSVESGAEILCQRDGDRLLVTVLLRGQPVTGAEVVVPLPGSSLPETLCTDAHGELRIDLPGTPLFGIRAKIVVPGAGERNGERYGETRHYATLTVCEPARTEGIDAQASGLLADARSCTARLPDGTVLIEGEASVAGSGSFAFFVRDGNVTIEDAAAPDVLDRALSVLFDPPGASPSLAAHALRSPGHEESNPRRWVLDLDSPRWSRVVLEERRIVRAERDTADGIESWTWLDTRFTHDDRHLPEHLVLTSFGPDRATIRAVETWTCAYGEEDGIHLPRSCSIEGWSNDGNRTEHTIRLRNVHVRAASSPPGR